MNDDELDVYRTKRQELMRKSELDGQALKKLVEAGLTWLRTNQQLVNALNVFPVPDGDTGINMVLTMQTAYDEIADSPERNFGKMAHALAHGALMGARGNSGVILSQLWRGFARGLDAQESLDAPGFTRALKEARDTAYKGVVRPVEGTILTVATDIAKSAEQALQESQDVIAILEKVVEAADESVEHTPELLSVLKEAGVVDAGGKGLFFILEGMLRYINGQSLDTVISTVQPLVAMNLEATMESIEPGQDFEVVVDFEPNQPLVLEKFYTDLEAMGTSIQVGEGDGIYRVHIHVPTENLYEPLNYTRSIGNVTKATIENLIAQMEQIEKKSDKDKLQLTPVEPGQVAVVAVSPGLGISRVFASLGANAIVSGGQTMNPSTQEIIAAFENLPTDKVVILPNNKNIILAAQAAAELTVKQVAVIHTRTIPQGLSAMMRLVPTDDLDQVASEMTESIQEVESGEITTATRNVEIDGVSCIEGDIIAIHNGKLVVSTDSLESALMEFLKAAQAQDFELITLFYGDMLSKQQVNQIVDIIRSTYQDQEIEVQEGGQPHYHFIISLE
jgi:uncharacterized protein